MKARRAHVIGILAFLAAIGASPASADEQERGRAEQVAVEPETGRIVLGASAEYPLVPEIPVIEDGDILPFDWVVVGSSEERRIRSFLSFLQKYAACLDKDYTVVEYEFARNSKALPLLVATLEDSRGWEERVFFDMTAICRMSFFSEEETCRRMRDYLAKIAASRKSVRGSLNNSLWVAMPDSLDRIDAQMKRIVEEVVEEEEKGRLDLRLIGEGFETLKNKEGETQYLKYVIARNSQGKTRRFYFDLLGDVYYRMRERARQNASFASKKAAERAKEHPVLCGFSNPRGTFGKP